MSHETRRHSSLSPVLVGVDLAGRRQSCVESAIGDGVELAGVDGLRSPFDQLRICASGVAHG
jgi:hypothetical protein